MGKYTDSYSHDITNGFLSPVTVEVLTVSVFVLRYDTVLATFFLIHS